MITSLRPTLVEAKGERGLTYSQTYYRVMQAVSALQHHELLHGKLKYNGQTCAVGAYFEQCKTSISSIAIEEIAAYNDSFPKVSPSVRWKKVNAWLKTRAKALAGQ